MISLYAVQINGVCRRAKADCLCARMLDTVKRQKNDSSSKKEHSCQKDSICLFLCSFKFPVKEAPDITPAVIAVADDGGDSDAYHRGEHCVKDVASKMTEGSNGSQKKKLRSRDGPKSLLCAAAVSEKRNQSKGGGADAGAQNEHSHTGKRGKAVRI